MKKALLILIATGCMLNARAVIRSYHIDPSLDQLTIKNYAGFPYNYNNFQISINASYYNLSSLTIASGSLNMGVNGTVKYHNLMMPNGTAEFGTGASIALWYPNSLPSNATTLNLVDFMQYGSGSHEYESVAVAAGKWTAGAFVNVAYPIMFSGGINDYGTGFYSTSTSINVHLAEGALKIQPNPVRSTAHFTVPAGFNPSGKQVDVHIYNLAGKLIMKTLTGTEYLIDCSDLTEGQYFVHLVSGEKTIVGPMEKL